MIHIDFESLRTIGLTQSVASQLATIDQAPEGTRLVRVTQVHRDWAVIHDGVAESRARSRNKLVQSLQAGDAALAVGDWVLAEPHAHGEQWLSERLAPLTHIARRASDGRRQSLASNVDTALLVMGLDHDFKLRRLERYLALAESSGVEPVVVLTKADIGLDVDERMRQLAERLPRRVQAFALNALGDEPARILAPWLAPGQTLILLGTSGAGKSTLTNALSSSHQETGGVRRGDNRGRHTTTARSLHQCPSGACIIDTPGLRSWQPDADEEALAASFDDIGELARHCQFRDCAHEEEPGCAVRGAVDPDRLLNYRKLLRDARRSQQTPLDRIAARNKWKVVIKAHNAKTRQRD
ncbi:ribosome small subunit-dependent GTPase A [Massilia genomosp. 1]|uniref:Small ribosomal subunit biogenesis GTPase RsgA n=1 Tax=Massilia genomosp. 1 TaxID=2609280 RepID=A0ABX0MQW7_9BURK|nr:ribosome small subunit-dependent GTPase A [Massilia genomosp. 1]NHZ62995.1 ribosome small subunit-dependent GTPase A [Massilia genomosp. 1]